MAWFKPLIFRVMGLFCDDYMLQCDCDNWYMVKRSGTLLDPRHKDVVTYGSYREGATEYVRMAANFGWTRDFRFPDYYIHKAAMLNQMTNLSLTPEELEKMEHG